MSQPPKTRSLSGASGTNSRIVGDLDSVRLPSLTVPISVREPIGLARPLRTAMTPAIVVVLTAPRPTRRMPSLPSAGAIERPVVTVGNYIIQDRALPAGLPGEHKSTPIMFNFLRRSLPPYQTPLAMIGAKPG